MPRDTGLLLLSPGEPTGEPGFEPGELAVAEVVLLAVVLLALSFLVRLLWGRFVSGAELREGVVGMMPCCANRSRAPPVPCPPVPTDAPPFAWLLRVLDPDPREGAVGTRSELRLLWAMGGGACDLRGAGARRGAGAGAGALRGAAAGAGTREHLGAAYDRESAPPELKEMGLETLGVPPPCT